MVPPAFPLLLFAPAIAIDLLLKRNTNDWIRSVMIGVAFVAVMLAVHWFWAYFMMSPAALNFFFGADQWDYSSTLGPWRYQWWNLDVDSAGKWSASGFAIGILTAMGIATVMSRLGLAWGKGMSRIQR